MTAGYASRRMRVRLAGLDIGSTTIRGVGVQAELLPGAAGRWEVAGARPVLAPWVELTPFLGRGLDVEAIARRLDEWLCAWAGAGGPPEAGGVLLTGLAAAATNAAEVVERVRAQIGDAVAVTASDPGLEAWVAFQAVARGRSLAEPGRWVVSLDIGGGTTNLAAGRDGEVERVGCVRVGARHLRVRPDGAILGCSDVGEAALAQLGLDRTRLTSADRDAVAALLVACLEATLEGREPPLAGLVELPFHPPWGVDRPVILLSGGVGELVVGPGAPDERWDDLGARMARRLRASSLAPTGSAEADGAGGLGAATVLGLAIATSEFAGSTVYAPWLPEEDVPIRGRLRADQPEGFVALSAGGAFRLCGCPTDRQGITHLADALGRSLGDRPTVLLVDADVALVIGRLLTGWGAHPRPLVVLDGLPPRDARVLRLRRGFGASVQVRYFGWG